MRAHKGSHYDMYTGTVTPYTIKVHRVLNVETVLKRTI